MTKFNLTPADIIEGRDWKYLDAAGCSSIGFMSKLNKITHLTKPETKSPKVNADYVWKSML